MILNAVIAGGAAIAAGVVVAIDADLIDRDRIAAAGEVVDTQVLRHDIDVGQRVRLIAAPGTGQDRRPVAAVPADPHKGLIRTLEG